MREYRKRLIEDGAERIRKFKEESTGTEEERVVLSLALRIFNHRMRRINDRITEMIDADPRVLQLNKA
jgi:hypothetical protein